MNALFTAVSNEALGLTMLALIVVVIMLGFPTAFTLMGLGIMFGWVAFYDPAVHFWDNRIFDLMVQRAFGAMNNDTLISIPLFVLMGYVMERGALVDKMFYSVQLAFRRVPGSLAVTTLIICTFWGIASGLVGAVVVLMGVIAMRPMLNAGYDVKLASGVITAGGTLGILIPPSVMIIVYAAVTGQSVVKLYAAAMFPGFFLALLYLVYVVGWVLINPKIAPRLPPEQMKVAIPEWLGHLSTAYSRRMLPALFAALVAPRKALAVPAGGAVSVAPSLGAGQLLRGLGIASVPLLLAVVTMGTTWWYVVIHSQQDDNPAISAPAARQADAPAPPPGAGGLQEPPGSDTAAPPSSTALAEPPGAEQAPAASGGLQEPPGADSAAASPPSSGDTLKRLDEPQAEASHAAVPVEFYIGFWLITAALALVLAWYYWQFDAEQFEILRMLTSSVMPLGILTFVVLAVILFGITTATESAGVGAAGAFLMAWQAKTLTWQRTKEAVFLTAKTTAMVCWLFIGSAIFSAVFAILGGQGLVEHWVLSLNMTPIQFMLLSQAIIFVLGWPLEWTEIIVIFVPIFLPLLQHFHIDPMLWGVLVFVNLQAAFLSPPVAMSAFYLKGVSPPHVTINQIFAGMMPYMIIVIICMVFMYIWPGMTLWLPNYLYGN
ncbi:TRAP transporter large permease subunit [Ramlibacter sp. G-1-2-2]|uniref:TRAP transporter large permease subunit n=1 Tax=Ramlibacter agri TaxID=2728837 RepID=A0A848HBW6_9BURK|nr:TRAP transporter large permease subunit [Ramlibacter agri]NML47974.1 TRAP transporter large permease subunit [Ramlibacter agri]